MNKETYLAQKQIKEYVERDNIGKAHVLDVDTEKNTVSMILNTFDFIDFDLDMLVPGSTVRSIQHRGPDSTANAKIQHLRDHIISTKTIVGKFLHIEETKFQGRNVLRADSKILDTDILLKYQEKVLNQHSIGFKYEKISLATRDSEDFQANDLFKEFFPRAINPEFIEDVGFFFVVKEVNLFEASTILFGSNSETAVTDIKNKDPKTQEAYLFHHLKLLEDLMLTGKFTDDCFKMMGLEIKQFKQAIIDIQKPDLKETLLSKNNTSEDYKARELLKHLNF